MSETILSEKDAKTAQAIMKKDKFLSKLAVANAELDGLEDLLKLLRASTPGPVKLILKWNQAQIEGWRRANDGVAKIGQVAICNDLDLARSMADNEEFFDEMYKARGCDNL